MPPTQTWLNAPASPHPMDCVGGAGFRVVKDCGRLPTFLADTGSASLGIVLVTVLRKMTSSESAWNNATSTSIRSARMAHGLDPAQPDVEPRAGHHRELGMRVNVALILLTRIRSNASRSCPTPPGR
jgi:hypothetical protein